MSARPLPVADERSRGYWEAAGRHVLALARCSVCGHLSHPPGIVCANCQTSTPEFRFERVDGSGAVRSWTVLHDSFLPGFADLVPMVLLDVELDAEPGLRLIGRLIDGSAAALHVGQRARVTFEDLGPGVAVPAFTLETTDGTGAT